MIFSKLYGLNQKKGISSIVGGIFFLVLMTSGFTVYYVALDSQSQMLHTQQLIADNEVAKIKEKFVVAASSSGVDNILSLQVVNTGNNSIEIADVWIVNKTDAAEPAARYDLDYRDVTIPVGHSGDILSNTPLSLAPEIFGIKVISSIGTIQAVEYDVTGGSNVLSAQMVAIPQDVRFGENVTVALIVTNVGEFDVKEVRANDAKFDVNPNQCRDPPNLIFGGPSDLGPSQSTMFFWDCVLDPPLLNTITFTGNATGLLSGVPVDSNDASDSVVVRDFTSAGGTLVLEQELLNRPEIFMAIPSPFGDDPNDLGLWGVNVVNPTPFPMDVSKVTITTVPSRPQMQDKVFDPKPPTGCTIATVSPTPDDWSCPVINQIMWKDFVTPITIPPRSVFPFLVTMEPGTVAGSGAIMENLIVQTNVFTTLGQFGKTGYGTSMAESDSALASVFLSRDFDSAALSDVYISDLGLLAQVPVKFNATIADLDGSSNFQIDDLSRIIINVPRDWSGVVYPFDSDFNISDTTFLGQTQIIGELNVDIVSGGKSLEFTATPPCVEDPTMYVMYVLADGTVSDGATEQMAIGPLAEIILQVVPNGSCS